jgi:hypothetical protein
MAWQMKGQLIENCSCNMFCPCWFGVQDLMIMDRGWCHGAFALRIDEGDMDGVGLGGRTVVFRIHFPGPTLFDGNASARLYVDKEASDDQRDAIETIFRGSSGGPMEQIAPLVSDWQPTEPANITIDEDGDTVTLSVGDAGQVRSQLLRDAGGNGFTLRGGGFVGGLGLEEAELAPSTGAAWSGDGMSPEPDVEMRSGARGAFAWAG